MGNLLWHELRVRRKSYASWTVVLSIFSVIYMVAYSVRLTKLQESNPEALSLLRSSGIRILSGFESFLMGTEFMVLPLVAGIFGVFMGISTLISEEDDGTLELLAALPISRVQLILAKASASVIAAFFVLVVAGLTAMGVFTFLNIDTSVTAPDIFWVILSTWLMTFVFLAISLFMGAFLPNRITAMSVTALILLGTFFGENLAGMAPGLEAWQPYFPFYYFKNVAGMLTGDVAWRDMAILLLIGISFLVLAVISFQRRNLTVGAWPWQKPKLPE